MKRKVFSFRSFVGVSASWSFDDHEQAVEDFCNEIGEDKVVSITGNPRCVGARDMYSSDDNRGYNYIGNYIVWYKD
jgi:hypothetical protein